MRALYFLVLFGIVYLNLAALTVLAGRFLPARAIARAAAVIGVCAVMFFIEHFVGLGSLHWLLLPLTALSCFVLWRYRAEFRQRSTIVGEAVFLIAVAYGLVWKLDTSIYPM